MEDITTAGMKVIGLRAVERRLDRVAQACAHQTSAFAQAVAYVDRWVQDNFKTQGGKVGGWKPLAEQTLASRRQGNKKKGRGSMILQDKGWLRSKWKHLFNDHSGSLVSGVDYGIYHDSDKPRHRLPQRRILPRNREIWPKLKVFFENRIGRSFHD